MDTRTCTYKYTSNYTKHDLDELLNLETFSDAKISLEHEYREVLKNIRNINNEIEVYKKYLTKFPVLSDIILIKLEEKKSALNYVYCEKSTLKTLIEAL